MKREFIIGGQVGGKIWLGRGAKTWYGVKTCQRLGWEPWCGFHVRCWGSLKDSLCYVKSGRRTDEGMNSKQQQREKIKDGLSTSKLVFEQHLFDSTISHHLSITSNIWMQLHDGGLLGSPTFFSPTGYSQQSYVQQSYVSVVLHPVFFYRYKRVRLSVGPSVCP